MKRSNGFTLVELVAIIATVSILAAVSGSRYVSSDVFETRGDAGLLSSTLRYAQKTAIAQRRVVYMVYSATVPPSLRLCFTLDCSQTVVNPENGNAYAVAFSKSVQVNAANIGFDSLGRPVPNANAAFVVTNKNNNGQLVTINVEADTGYIH